MKLYVLKKEKLKKYDSKSICNAALNFDLQYENNKPLACSITDTKNYWACAIGDCGIDMEEKGRRVKPSIVRSLHKSEQDYLSGLSFGSSEWNDEFFHIWTAKEALYKLTGLSFKQLSVVDDNLERKQKIDDYNILYSENKSYLLCLVSRDDYLEIENIKFAGVSAKSCIDYAAELLSVKAYSSKDIAEKLKTKGYNEAEIKECTERLKEFGYINDSDYAQRYIENALQSGKGAAYIKSKLMQSGISKDDMPEIDFEKQYESAMELAKELFKDTDDYEEKQKLLAKIARRLASRGFEAKVVYKVLDRLK